MAEIDWARLESLFERAVALPKEAQEAFIADNAGDSPELAAQLRAMLAADAQATSGSDLLARAQASDNDLIGTEIDRWQLLERIGSGGMGVVFLAERTDGNLEQRAALKIIKRGMDTDHVVQRFRQERQILAKLEHPNIARVYDGGVTVDGRPYFVMEHVDGLPITTYCDTNKLGIEQRLKLFQRVCDAVHAAHRNLIVHRDLKPENIFITRLSMDERLVKVLDFGLSKVIDTPARARTGPRPTISKEGEIYGTPNYMAPEQAYAQRLTAATDVYAVGLLTYELLTGQPAFLAPTAVDTLLKQVNEPIPELPAHLRGSVLEQFIDMATKKDAGERILRRGFADAAGERRDLAAEPRPRRRAQQKAEPLDRVLGPRQQRHPAKEPVAFGRGQQLDRGFRRHLGQILGHAGQPLHQHDEHYRRSDGPRRVQLRQGQQRHHLQAKPNIQRRGQPEPRRDPARAEVRHNSGNLIKNKQIGQLHRRKAQRVEVQQHQHPQRTIGEHESPIGRSDRDIGRQTVRARRSAHSASPTISATSTRRCA